ncbi:MAG: GNAT family N-acetyltransferase [Anaerolineae bacterium]|nr:GNAT family N-acetyltransferase [Anaerolineae bacterium]
MMTIRPFEYTDADYEAFAAMERSIWPGYPDTVEEWKHRDGGREPGALFCRFLAEVGGVVVGAGQCCEPWRSREPGKYQVRCDVHPDFRHRGIGTALYDRLVDLLAEHQATILGARTREDKADGVRFLTHRGFEQVMRSPISHLDVGSFDADRFAGRALRVAERGIQIEPLACLADADPDWKQKLWALTGELYLDLPSHDSLTQQTFEEFEERSLGAPGFNAGAHFVALDGERWVGTSSLWVPQGEPDKLYTGLTGVVRSHRRQGIAIALKVRGIIFARRIGAQIIQTDNAEHNPMYWLNLQLGFEPQAAWLDFRKELA